MANVAAMANPQPIPHDVQHGDNQMATSWEGDRMFNIYIHDYCIKRGFEKTAQQLVQEAKLEPDFQPPINAKQGLLFEWWSVFWVLFTAKSTPGGTEDAQTYFQHQMRQRMGTTQPVPPNRPMPNGPTRPPGAPPLPNGLPSGAPGALMHNGIPGGFALGPQAGGGIPNGLPGAPGAPPQAHAPGPNPSPQQTHFPPGAMIPPPGQQPGQPGPQPPQQPPQQGRPIGAPPMPGQAQPSFPPPGAPPGTVAAAQRNMGMFSSPTMAPSPQASGAAGAQPNRAMPPPGTQGSPFPPGMQNSRPNTPGTKPLVNGAPPHGMPQQQQQHPMAATMEAQQIDVELSRFPQAFLMQVRGDVKQEKEISSLSIEEKRQLLQQARQFAHSNISLGMPLSANAIAGPSAINNNGKAPMAPPGRPQVVQPQNATQRVKRSSTSPTDEHETLPKTESSPPDRKRMKTTPGAGDQPMQQQPQPPQPNPGFMPQQAGVMGGLPGGPNIPNGAMARPGMPPGTMMGAPPQPGMGGAPPGMQFPPPGHIPQNMPMMGHTAGGAGVPGGPQMMVINNLHPAGMMNLQQQKHQQDWHKLGAMGGAGTGSPSGPFGPSSLSGGASPLAGVMQPGQQNKPPTGMPPPPSPGAKMGGPQQPPQPGGPKDGPQVQQSPRLLGMRPPQQQPQQQQQQQQQQPGSLAGTPQLTPAGTNPPTPVAQQGKVPSPATIPMGAPPGAMGGGPHGPGPSGPPPPLAGTGPGGFGGVDFGPGIFGEGFMSDSLGDGSDIDTFSFLSNRPEDGGGFDRDLEHWFGGNPLGGEDPMMK